MLKSTGREGGETVAGLDPFVGMRLPYTTLLALRFGAAAIRARRAVDARWEHLVETYPDRLEALEVAFGRHLREHYPEVRSAHGKAQLTFAHGDGRRLSMEIAEPIRGDLGWGGLNLTAWHGESPVRLAASELLLTLLRGVEPEWMARAARGRLVHRLIVVDGAFVANVSRQVFGGPSP